MSGPDWGSKSPYAGPRLSCSSLHSRDGQPVKSTLSYGSLSQGCSLSVIYMVGDVFCKQIVNPPFLVVLPNAGGFCTSRSFDCVWKVSQPRLMASRLRTTSRGPACLSGPTAFWSGPAPGRTLGKSRDDQERRASLIGRLDAHIEGHSMGLQIKKLNPKPPLQDWLKSRILPERDQIPVNQGIFLTRSPGEVAPAVHSFSGRDLTFCLRCPFAHME